MNLADPTVCACVAGSKDRFEFWGAFLRAQQARRVAEIGVFRGDFAARILRECESVETYYMVDPWRHLDDWNKPANKPDEIFEQFLAETIAKTAFAARKRVVLRGRTTEVIDAIPDGELDFAYIDGDHTLRGIAIDLIRTFPKIRTGGWIGGDDFSRTIWQHAAHFEPTLVFPFAVHFAEAVGARIHALPYNQFLVEKSATRRFSFVDVTDTYDDTGLADQFGPDRIPKALRSG